MIMSVPTPINKPTIKKKKIKEFNLSFDNKQFIAQIILSDIIRLNLLEKDNISSIMYSINLTLKELGQYKKFLKCMRQ